LEKLVYRNGTRQVIIKDKLIISLILNSYADEDKKKILNVVSSKPRIILDIIHLCKLPQTSSYRKINLLIKNGLLIADGKILRKYGKMVTKYVSLFENLEINIVKNDISIKAKFSEDARQAIFRMMRNKIVNFRKRNLTSPKNYHVIETGPISIPADSMIPFLLKERIIKI
jgi:predicted transcriptional regulator